MDFRSDPVEHLVQIYTGWESSLVSNIVCCAILPLIPCAVPLIPQRLVSLYLEGRGECFLTAVTFVPSGLAQACF